MKRKKLKFIRSSKLTLYVVWTGPICSNVSHSNLSRHQMYRIQTEITGFLQPASMCLLAYTTPKMSIYTPAKLSQRRSYKVKVQLKVKVMVEFKVKVQGLLEEIYPS